LRAQPLRTFATQYEAGDRTGVVSSADVGAIASASASAVIASRVLSRRPEVQLLSLPLFAP
jgi:hypothetical protein